jgi:predicted PurR-regulated permease PerM
MYIFALFIISFIVPTLCAAEQNLVNQFKQTIQASNISGYDKILEKKLSELENNNPEQYQKLIEHLKKLKQSSENQSVSEDKTSGSVKPEKNN